MERIFRRHKIMKEDSRGGQSPPIQDCRVYEEEEKIYADHGLMLEEFKGELQVNVNSFERELSKNMIINIEKTNTMVIGANDPNTEIDRKLE